MIPNEAIAKLVSHYESEGESIAVYTLAPNTIEADFVPDLAEVYRPGTVVGVLMPEEVRGPRASNGYAAWLIRTPDDWIGPPSMLRQRIRGQQATGVTAVRVYWSLETKELDTSFVDSSVDSAES